VLFKDTFGITGYGISTSGRRLIVFEWLYDLFPFTVFPSSLFCDIELGQVFTVPDSDCKYRLLDRDAFKVRIVRWNSWTKLWWGKEIAR